MKVLFINKYDTLGGAGILAFRLATALGEQGGVTSRFLVGSRRSSDASVVVTRKAGIEEIFERGLNVLSSAAGFQYVGFPFSTSRIRRIAREWKPDVISAHNLHGGFFKLELLRELSSIAPIVWTMHDMWAFTASSAHTFGDESWKTMHRGPREHRQTPWIGIPNGDWLLRRKRRIYDDSRLTFVGPSEWITSLARQSPLLSGKRVVHIPNGINTRIFSPKDRKTARERLGIPPDALVVAFGAEKVLQSSHKGGNLLLDIIRELDARVKHPVHVILFGHQSSAFPVDWTNIRVHPVGYVKEEEEVARILSGADVYMHPSKADTFPMTLLEASACGIPCVTHAVGGCTEIIADGQNGFAVPGSDTHIFVDRVLDLLEQDGLREKLSKGAVRIAQERFSLSQMARSYRRLFGEVIEKKGEPS